MRTSNRGSRWRATAAASGLSSIPDTDPVVGSSSSVRPGSTAGVEDVRLRGGAQRQSIELGADDRAPTAVPPVVLVDVEHGLHQAFVHPADAARRVTDAARIGTNL